MMADIKNNLSATIDPNAGNDASQGYVIGSSWFNRNTGEQWTCANATTGSAEWILTAFDDQYWPSGFAQFAPGITALTDRTPAAGLLIAQKFVFHRKVNINSIGIHLTTPQTGCAVRMGMYGLDRSTGGFGALVKDAGELSLDSAVNSAAVAGARLFLNGMNAYLNPGIYFAAALFKQGSTPATVKGISTSAMGIYPRAIGEDLSTPGRYLVGTVAYGALPSAAPSMTFSSGTDGAAVMLGKA
jgi:hypothetical protein